MSQGNLLSVMDSIDEALIVIDDASGTCAYSNEFARRLFGDDLVGRELGNYAFARSSSEAEILSVHGETLTVDITVTETSWADRPARAILIRDITQQRLHEQQLRHVDVMNAIGTMTAGIAHDFNNVLAASMGMLELALIECEQEEVRDSLEQANQALEHGSQAVGRLLALARTGPEERTVLDARRFLRSIESMLRHAARIRDFAVTPGPLTSAPVYVDPTEFTNAVLNLVTNARDAVADHPSPAIRVELVPDDEQIRIRVRDNGPGIPDHLREQVLRPFFTTKGSGQGTGLGLSSVQSFMIREGGELHLENDGGAVVEIRLPRVSEPESSVMATG